MTHPLDTQNMEKIIAESPGQFRAGLEAAKDVAEKIVALAPSDLAMSLYVKRIRWAWERNTSVEPRYEDRVSAVLLIRFGDARIILGADALKANWREIIDGPYFKSDRDVAQ